MKKRIFLLASVFSFSICSFGQLKYRSDGRLTFGNVDPVGSYNTHYSAWGHYYSFVGNGYDTYMKFCLGATAPRISGALNQIVFYNSEASVFNSIQVANVYNYSDARAKTNVKELSNGTDIVKKLRPISYNFVNVEQRLNSTELGLIAQEVEKVVPELVLTDSEGKKLINYIGLIPVLIKAVQDLQTEMEMLKKK